MTSRPSVNFKNYPGLEIALFSLKFRNGKDAETFCKDLEANAKANETWEWHGMQVHLPSIPITKMRLIAEIEPDETTLPHIVRVDVFYGYVDVLPGIMPIRIPWDEWEKVKDVH